MIELEALADGAEAKLYGIELLGTRMVVKRREKKRYRAKALDEKLRKERTRREARIMQSLSRLRINSPRIIGVGLYSICMEHLDGRLLKDASPDARQMALSGRLLAKMHDNNIVHGDFTPANLMLCGGEVYVIDFGLSEFTRNAEERALDLLLMKRSVAKGLYSKFQEAYAANAKGAKETFARLREIELRGRYQLRTLA